MFQVKAQLERTSSAKLDEMLSIQKVASDKTGLGYEFSSLNISSSSEIVFISPVNDNDAENNEAKIEIASENLDKGKSFLGVPPKVLKKETRHPRNKKDNNKKSQQKKSHFCHHYGVLGHSSKLLEVVSHSIKQQCVIIWWSRSDFTIFRSS